MNLKVSCIRAFKLDMELLASGVGRWSIDWGTVARSYCAPPWISAGATRVSSAIWQPWEFGQCVQSTIDVSGM